MARNTAAVVVGAALVIAVLPAGGAAREKVERKVGAELVELDHSDVSPPLRRIVPIPPRFQDNEEHEVKRLPHHHPFRALGRQPDLALQSAPGPLVGTTPGVNFDGVGLPGYTPTGAPPDTNGAIGATQYVQWVNTAFSVFDKATGNKLYGPANGNTLWQGFGGRCESDNSGDPIVVYDKAAGRWLMTQFAVSQAPYFQCIAVSTTSDATDRNQMLTPSGTPGAMQCFQLSTTYGGLLPSDLDGSTPPPAGSPNYFVAFNDVSLSGLNLWKFHVDWTSPASATFTGPVSIPTAAFTEACNGGTCITQPSTTQRLDSLADRLMYRLAYRNFGDHESLVVNHSVDVSGHAGVRWYEVRSPNAGPTVFQQGTFSPDASHRWMGSIGQDRSGNMLLGYSVSSTTVRPSIRYTGRLATDPAGTMQAETEMFTGVGSQTATLSRWGDYSALTIDPVDDCTFWYTNEYLKASGTFNWSTRIASFRFDSCGGTPTPDFSVGASPSSVSVTQGSSANSTITVTSLNGFNGAVSLSASGLPSGVSASFSINPVTPPANGSATSTLTLTASATATTGAATISVTGTSGGTSHSTSISLTVNPAGGGGAQTAVFDSALRAPKCATVGISCDSGTSLLLGRDGKGPEPSQPNTINGSCADGTSGTFHSDESNDRIKVSTTDGSAFATGKAVRIDATVWAWTSPSSDHLDLYYAADATSPAWTLVATLTPTAAGAQTLSGTYTLPAGPLQAVRAHFRYLGSATACSTGAYDDHDDLVFAVTPPAPDTTPPTTSITAPAAGATVSGTTTVTATATDDVGVTRVEFYVDGALKATDTAAPYTFAWDTTAYAAGSHGLATMAYDAAGNVGTSATVTVTVSNTGPVTVFYDGAESATTTLTFTSTTSDTQWFRNSTSPYAGTWRYRAGNPANPTGNYGNNGDARMTTPVLNLAGASTATLTYAFKHSTEASFDFFEVRLSTDGGTNWTTLVHVSGQSASWNLWAPLATINLNAYAGQSNVTVDEIKVVKQ